jgi:DNA-binding SARP family transcriptional activator
MKNLVLRSPVPVTLVDVPRGHGRRELFRSTFGSPSPDHLPNPGREVFVTGGGRINSAVSLAEALIELLSPSTRPSNHLQPDEHPADVLIGALAEAALAGPMLVAIDDAHRAGADAINLLSEIATRLPANISLVIGGTGLRSLQLGELELDNRLRRIGPSELRLKPVVFPETYEFLFREAFENDVGEDQRKLISALTALGLTNLETCRRAATALGVKPDVLVGLDALPGVVLSAPLIDIHDEWRFASTFCDPDDRKKAGRAAGFSILEASRDADGVDNAGNAGNSDNAGNAGNAGRIALEIGDAELLRASIRSALFVQPSTVSAHQLRAWQDSGLLAGDDTHAHWVAAASALAHGAGLDEAFILFERARVGFAEALDFDAEIATGIASAILARRRNDLGAIALLIMRAQELVVLGCDSARPLALSGEALGKQMAGDSLGALDSLSRIAEGSVSGDWAAQVHMMRSLNLLLLGRLREAIDELVRAAGCGGPWSYAVTLDQLAFARWRTGDAVGAMAEIAEAQRIAEQTGTRSVADQVGALQTIISAACGQLLAGSTVETSTTLQTGSADPEARRLLAIADVLKALAIGELDEACVRLDAIDPPQRAVRSTSWALALQVALQPAKREQWAEVVDRHPALKVSLVAGDAGAVFLRTGVLAPESARPFLPWAWCAGSDSTVEVTLIGGSLLKRNGKTINDPHWDRIRVRELCLCLAVADGVSRDRILGWLWPDLPTAAAQRNLRVTLSYLLDALDPRRQRGAGSRLISDTGGVLTLARTDTLTIDIRTRTADCAALLRAHTKGDRTATLAAARRLVRHRVGPVLGGVPLGDWFEPFERDIQEQLLRALTKGAHLAAEVGDVQLASELAGLGLEVDPWAERLHVVLVNVLLRQDDLDGARRAMRRALHLLQNNGLEPETTTLRLARNLGISPSPLR